MDEIRKEVNIGIRSVLTSSAKLLNVNELFYDYIKLIGSPIPLRSLGYRNLHEYLRSIPDVVSLDHPESLHSIVRPVVDAKTRHIANFVKEQKVSKNAKTSRRPYLRRSRVNEFVPFDLRHRIYDRLQHYPEGIHLDDFRNLVDQIQREMGTRCTFDVILEKMSFCTSIADQYISITQTPKTMQAHNDIVTAEDESESDYGEWFSDEEEEEYVYSPDQVNGDANNVRPGSARSKSKSRRSSESGIELVSDSLVKNLYALLDENPGGMWLTDLAKKYAAKYGYSLDPNIHGFDCVLDMVNTLKHVFIMTQYEKSGDRYLKDARKHIPEDTDPQQGELPKSVVCDIKKMIQSRLKPQIYTDELIAEYKERYRKTFDPTEFGFPNLACLLQSLVDNESSTFSIKTVVNRQLLYLRNSFQEEDSDQMQYKDALPDGVNFDIIPKEVCNYDVELPVNPILKQITKGMRIRVQIAEVYSPERFYLHFDDDVASLNMMMEDLHQFYETNGENFEVFHDTVRRGMLCACPFSGDSKWHRVQIITSRGTARTKARFLDYGTAEEVAVTKLRYLHLDFARLPAMAIRTKLNGIKPVPNEEKKSYSRNVCEYFFNLAKVNYLEAEILNADLTNLSLEVSLYAHQNEGPPICVHEKLLELGLVAKKEIDNHVEVPSQSRPIAATSNLVPNGGTPQIQTPVSESPSKKKSRPPPGIPVPPNLNSAAYMSNPKPATSLANSNASSALPNFNVPNSLPKSTLQSGMPNFNAPVTSMPTFTKVDSRPTFSTSKMNPLNPPFYPSSFVPPPQMVPPPPPPPQPPMYAPPQRPYVYSMPPQMRVPPQYGMNYGHYSGIPNPYEYYYMQMRAPPTYFISQPTKPPPGFDCNAKSSQPPDNMYFCGDPLYKNSTTKEADVCLSGCCGCGFDCQTPPQNVSSQTDTRPRTSPPTMEAPKPKTSSPAKEPLSKELPVGAQPEWIIKLEMINKLIKTKNVSQDAINERLGQVINEINQKNETSKNATKTQTKTSSQNVVFESPAPPSPPSPPSPPIQPKSPAQPVFEEKFPKLHDLITSLNEPATKQPETNSSSRAESECSCQSDSKASTLDELKNEKLKQLKMFVLLQNRTLKKV